MWDATNRRATSRRRVLKGGKIIFRAGFAVINCLVRDESPSGARLKVPSVIGVPDAFELQIANAKPRQCHVIWRTGQELGVAFVE